MTTTIPINLDSIVLEKGAHDSPNDGMCVMELAAYLAHEKHSDRPTCVSPVLGAFLRNWNDSVDDDFRQRLKPYAARVLNTAKDGKDEIRAWMATDWLVRVCAPAWLDLCKLTEHAMALRSAEEIRDIASANRVQPLLDGARKDAYAAWDAARDAARDAAWDAARAAARDAARDAARAAAWAAAWDAAWDAGWDTAWDAARAAAWAAARATAWDTAWDAARAAARAAARDAARDAAWAAAWTALKPTVEALQASALELLDRMIAGTEIANER